MLKNITAAILGMVLVGSFAMASEHEAKKAEGTTEATAPVAKKGKKAKKEETATPAATAPAAATAPEAAPAPAPAH